MRRSRCRHGGPTGPLMIWSTTLVTPGADQATRSASSRSIHERTVPLRTTSLPLVSTMMRLASTSALRLNASWIFFLISVGSARGLSWIRLLTPLTPLMRRTALSAVFLWYCHSTWPSSVTQPFLTTILMCSEEIGSWLLIADDRIACDIGIGPLVDARHAHLDIVRHGLDAGNALGGGFGFVLVGVALHESRQRHDAVLHLDGDVGRIEVRIPRELVLHVSFNFAIGSHVDLRVDCWSARGRSGAPSAIRA